MSISENNLENQNIEDSALQKDEQNTKLITSINYDVQNDEEGQAFLLFQKKFVYKKNWIKTIAFALVAVVFLISIALKPEQAANYIFATICIAAIFIIWYNTKKIRTSLMDALKLIEDDRYIFSLYEDRFRIETILSETEDENGEEIAPVEPRTVLFEGTHLNVYEDTDKFVVIIKKDTIYVLPKRCMNENQAEILRTEFSKHLGENFEKIDK